MKIEVLKEFDTKRQIERGKYVVFRVYQEDTLTPDEYNEYYNNTSKKDKPELKRYVKAFIYNKKDKCLSRCYTHFKRLMFERNSYDIFIDKFCKIPEFRAAYKSSVTDKKVIKWVEACDMSPTGKITTEGNKTHIIFN